MCRGAEGEFRELLKITRVTVIMDYVCLGLQVLLLVLTLGVVVKFSWEIGKRKFLGVERVQHNRCYTDGIRIEMTHGNMEPHI